MKVLTIRQPWATLIMEGYKRFEFRSWKTNYRGELYIHASLSLSKSENVEKANKYLKSEIKPGYILCRCELVNCIPMTKDFIEYIYIESIISAPVCFAIRAAIPLASFFVQCPDATNLRSRMITPQ